LAPLAQEFPSGLMKFYLILSYICVYIGNVHIYIHTNRNNVYIYTSFFTLSSFIFLQWERNRLRIGAGDMGPGPPMGPQGPPMGPQRPWGAGDGLPFVLWNVHIPGPMGPMGGPQRPPMEGLQRPPMVGQGPPMEGPQRPRGAGDGLPFVLRLDGGNLGNLHVPGPMDVEVDP